MDTILDPGGHFVVGPLKVLKLLSVVVACGCHGHAWLIRSPIEITCSFLVTLLICPLNSKFTLLKEFYLQSFFESSEWQLLKIGISKKKIFSFVLSNTSIVEFWHFGGHT